MPKKCPYCGSKNTTGTNVGARVTAVSLSFVAGVAASIFGPGAARVAQREVNKNVCPRGEYICLDCKKEFSETRY